MEYPVCLEDRRVGTLYACAAPDGAELRSVCRAERGLYRLYVRGSGGEVLLGVTEDGCLRRCFSRELLLPAGELRCAVLRRCGEAPRQPDLLRRLPPQAQIIRRDRLTEVVIPRREDAPFPLEELFCFARAEAGRVTYLFNGAGRPVMPR